MEFCEQALSKARQRGVRTLASVADELSLPLGTVKAWLKASNKRAAGSAGATGLPSGVTAREFRDALKPSSRWSEKGPAGHSLLTFTTDDRVVWIRLNLETERYDHHSRRIRSGPNHPRSKRT